MSKPICHACAKPIERGTYRNPLWVKLWCVKEQKPVFYHVSCWNRQVAAEMRWQDAMMDKHL